MSRRKLKSVKGVKYLAKCELGYYYFRRRIPEGAKHAFSQKKEVLVSLRETVKRHALIKHGKESRQFEVVVKQALRELKIATSCTSPPKRIKIQGIGKIDDDLVDFIAKSWFVGELKKDHKKLIEIQRLDKLSDEGREDYFNSIGGNWGRYIPRSDNPKGCERLKHCHELNQSIEILEASEHELDLEQSLVSGDSDSLSIDDDPDALFHEALGANVGEVAQEYAQVKLSEAGESYSRLRELMRKGRIENLKRFIESYRSDFRKYDKDDFFRGLSHKTTLVDPRKAMVIADNISVYELEDKFRNRLRDEDKVYSSHYKTTFHLLALLLGGDNYIRDFGREEAFSMKEAISKLPKGFTTKNTSINELLEAEKGIFGDTISSNYKHQLFATLRTILDYARRARYLEINHLEDPAFDKTFPKVNSQRVPFTVTDLNALFGSAEFQKSRGEYPYNANYWIPVLSLFHGFRLGEICELEISDLTKSHDYDWINIQLDSSTGQRKHLKTESSKRVIPLHPDVKRLGFLDYVEMIRKSDNQLLFPTIKTTPTKRKSDYFSKTFSRLRDKVFKDRPMLSFHSLRHTFRTEISEKTNDEVGVRLLGGWAMPKDASFGYFHGYSEEEKIRLIEKIDYEGLDLKNLRRTGQELPKNRVFGKRVKRKIQ